MSAPQPNESTQPTGHLPPVISVPTTARGAVQSMMSMIPSLGHSQDAPPAHPVAGSPHNTPAGSYVPASTPSPHGHGHAPALASPTQIAADVAIPALAASASSYGERLMSTLQPNESTQHTGHLPPVISVPTTSRGAVQTMMSMIPSLGHSQGAPSAHPVAGSSHETPAGTYAPGSAPPAHAHAPSSATQIAADIAIPALAASASSYGGRLMNALQPNESAQHTGHLPPVISVPTTSRGAVQTMMSMIPSLGHTQDAPSSHPVAVSPHEMAPGTYVPGATPPPNGHAPATQIAADVAVPATAASISSQGGRPHSPPRATARVTRSSSALPELSYIHPRPIPVPGGEVFRRSTATAHHADDDSFLDTRDDRSEYKFKFFKTKSRVKRRPHYEKDSVGARMDPTVEEAENECEKAEWTAQITTFALHLATGLQILIGALTTALGAALSGKNTSVAISTLGGASTLVASYLARSRSTNEPEASRTRAASLKHFLREIRAFQLDHGSEMGDKYDDKIKGFRVGLEHLLGHNQASAVPGQAGAGLGAGGAMDPKAGITGAGMFSSSPPQHKMEYTV